MRTALDTNILSALWSGEAGASEVAKHLGEARLEGALIISGVVFAELIASPHVTEPYIIHYLERRAIQVDFQLGQIAWTEAGRRFKRYATRRRESQGGEPRRLLADFLVGAHALAHADRLMTLDTTRYRQDFPELRLYP